MNVKQLKAKVQKRINRKVSSQSRHFSEEPMNRQIEVLIEIITETFIQKEEKDAKN